MPRPRPGAARPVAPTRALLQLDADVVLPYGLGRQVDPTSPAWAPAVERGELHPVAHRERAVVGTLGSPHRPAVDPRGLVTPRVGGWSLDWWVGADDRWHVPSREAAVRQRLLDDAPVVETAVRIPGGDAVSRVWAFRDASTRGGGDVLAVEVENASRVPFALALAIRPLGPDGAAPVHEIEVRGTEVHVDGALALWLPRPAARLALSTRADGDVAAVVLGGDAPEDADGSVRCPDGLATAAVVVPLAHTATARVLVPLDRPGPPRRRRSRGDVDEAAPTPPTAVPPADAVARGWTQQAGRGLRVELPDAELAGALRAARAQVLVAAGGLRLARGDAAEPGAPPARDVAAVLRALDRTGLHDEVGAVLATVGDAPGPDGRLGGPDDDATAAVLGAVGEHWRLGRDAELARALLDPVVAAVGALERARAGGRRSPAGVPAGLLPAAGPGPGEVGPTAARFVDTARALRGVVEAGRVLDGLGHPEAAADVATLADEVRRDLDAALAAAGARLGGPIPAGPDRRRDGGVVAALALVAPLDLLDPASPAVDATVAAVRERFLVAHRVVRAVGATGLSARLTADWARVLLRRGDPAAVDAVLALVAAGGPSRWWPELAHPRHGGGCAGAGWDPVAAAGFVDAVRELLVLERRAALGDGVELWLSPVVPEAWLGAGWEVHDAPTAAGRLSYAVRWHGERPALLWELAPHEGAGPVVLRAPGLDPSWSTGEPRGEALLAAPAAPAPSAGEPAPPAGEHEPPPDGPPDGPPASFA
jgi:hypothetical protein